MRQILHTAACVALLVTLASPAFAEIKMPAMFSDNAILQQGMEVPVWGWAKPEATVQLKIFDQTKETKAGKDGKWAVKLSPMKVNTKPTVMTVTDGDGKKEWRGSGILSDGSALPTWADIHQATSTGKLCPRAKSHELYAVRASKVDIDPDEPIFLVHLGERIEPKRQNLVAAWLEVRMDFIPLPGSWRDALTLEFE